MCVVDKGRGGAYQVLQGHHTLRVTTTKDNMYIIHVHVGTQREYTFKQFTL